MNLLDLSKKVNEEIKDFIIRIEKEKSEHNSFINDKKQLTKQNLNVEGSIYTNDKNSINQDSTAMINSYEPYLIKLEQDIRMHIKTEFQLKIYCESLESKIESSELEISSLKKLLEENKIKHDHEINKSKVTIDQLIEVI
jgi:hypothetical protein